MKAIQVRYLGPTNNRGSRFKAFVANGASVTVPYHYGASTDDNARIAADALMDKLAWAGVAVNGMGSLPNGDYVFTLSA